MESRANKSNPPPTVRNMAEETAKASHAPATQIEGAVGKDESQPKSTQPPPISTSAVMQTDETTLKNQKLVEEFQYLLEKSQSLFAGLRDLPPTGSNRQWKPYFEKTFEVYTKLWKFQQIHRAILEDKNYYGLKRWEIGEIASKIGQLYYHYYLRTSETNYLNEASVFYQAIHDRQYFKDILDVRNSALMIKKMRYYARFIVVCLLLNNNDDIRHLISELEALVDEYVKTFKPGDANEWHMVIEEITTFMDAEKKLIPINADKKPVQVAHRLPAHVKSSKDKQTTPKLRLQEAILVGNYQHQIKFSELTLDMYRMLQSLEKEPTSNRSGSTTTAVPTPSSEADAEKKDAPSSSKVQKLDEQSTVKSTPSAAQTTTVPVTGATAGNGTVQERMAKRVNPHKYLLHRPTLSQLMVYISTAFKDISDTSAMFIYLSADGMSKREDTTNPAAVTEGEKAMKHLGYSAGITTSQRKTNDKGVVDGVNSTGVAGGLYPGDLIPFTRKPMFLIVDSNNSLAFKDMVNVFDQPFMAILSPIEYPSSVQDKSEIGSLFTLFLHAPLLGFCAVSDIGNLEQTVWNQCVVRVNEIEAKITDLLYAHHEIDPSVLRFMQDDFLRSFIVRTVLCTVILRCHLSFKEEKSYPATHPPLPQDVLSSSEVIMMLRDLTVLADVTTYFSFPASYLNTAVAPSEP
ncbi:hypothetical protein INT44_001525 [Umbelopsis vinacea]|uniref:Protein SCAI n=1 Tax=Umbelopsis vinacea TaxID=44442 RepID=A0A8H7UFV6_9FUNG|nr:hypothetical protein INT44_001525 [Umbelopsis vinacea]